MTKLFKSCIGAALLASLVGCQSLDTRAIKKLAHVQPKDNARVYCLGVENCEFERLDQTVIVSAETGRVTRAAIEQGLVRLRTKRISDANSLYLSVPKGQHELVIRYYPISPERAETFHIFHNFQASQQYQFVMYRKRTKQHRNLLSASSPDPLCVAIQRNRQTIRRFCRAYNVETGLGEFKEQKI